MSELTRLNEEEQREIVDLRAKGYKEIYLPENTKPGSTCLLCSSGIVFLASYAVDDNKKEIIFYALCFPCLLKIAASNQPFQKIMNQIIDNYLQKIRG